MSDAHHNDQPHAHDDTVHEGPIKTPKQLIVTVAASFILPVIIIIMLVNFVARGDKESPGSAAFDEKAVAQRIEPVGKVEVKDLSDAAAMKTGAEVYTTVCAACHATGMLNAPKFGDAAAWAPRIATGYAALLTSALKGKGNMPPQGGGDYTEFEIGRAVVHMANSSGGSLPEPKMPAAAASAAPTASAP